MQDLGFHKCATRARKRSGFREQQERWRTFTSGDIKSRWLPWRLSIIFETFWAILNFIGTFFTTLFSLEESKTYGKKSGARMPTGFGHWPGGPGGPSGGSGRGPYGGSGDGAPRGLTMCKGLITLLFPLVVLAVWVDLSVLVLIEKKQGCFGTGMKSSTASACQSVLKVVHCLSVLLI